jgi:poly(3-hydroxybutyrate) depolymerase
MRKDRAAPRGTVQILTLDSHALRGNLLGDPQVREVGVYTPAGVPSAGLPLLVDLVGFTGSGLSHLAWRNFDENVPERLDRLIAAGMPPVVVAFPDCFTRLGGNQYINSVAMGRWEDFLIDEMLPAVESTFRCGGSGRRGVFGKSSGGYGALVHAMKHADVWSAAASHSGDVGFDLVYGHDFPTLLRTLARHGGSIEALIRAIEGAQKVSDADSHALMPLAMAATYDPDPNAFLGIRLPVDLHTCERIEARWNQWLRWDPLVMVHEHAEALRSLCALYIDCGTVDQYHLQYGSRILHRTLDELRIAHSYEEFPDDHSKIDYRMDISLPLLARALS